MELFLILLFSVGSCFATANGLSTVCEGEPSGKTFRDVEGRCDRYIKCVNGWPVNYSCSEEGTVYDHGAMDCISKEKASAPCGDVQVVQVLSTADFSCAGRADGNYAPEGAPACASFFYQCRQGAEAKRVDCLAPLSYDPNADSCVLQKDNPTCTAGAGLTLTENACRGRADGVYAHPAGVCTEYLSCTQGLPVLVECAQAGHVWNDAERRCTETAMVAPPCGDMAPNATATTVAEPSTVTFACGNGTRAGNHAVPGVPCAQFFFQCHANGDAAPQVVVCPHGLAYAERENKCIAAKRCRHESPDLAKLQQRYKKASRHANAEKTVLLVSDYAAVDAAAAPSTRCKCSGAPNAKRQQAEAMNEKATGCPFAGAEQPEETAQSQVTSQCGGAKSAAKRSVKQKAAKYTKPAAAVVSPADDDAERPDVDDDAAVVEPEQAPVVSHPKPTKASAAKAKPSKSNAPASESTSEPKAKAGASKSAIDKVVAADSSSDGDAVSDAAEETAPPTKQQKATTKPKSGSSSAKAQKPAKPASTNTADKQQQGKATGKAKKASSPAKGGAAAPKADETSTDSVTEAKTRGGKAASPVKSSKSTPKAAKTSSGGASTKQAKAKPVKSAAGSGSPLPKKAKATKTAKGGKNGASSKSQSTGASTKSAKSSNSQKQGRKSKTGGSQTRR